MSLLLLLEVIGSLTKRLKIGYSQYKTTIQDLCVPFSIPRVSENISLLSAIIGVFISGEN